LDMFDFWCCLGGVSACFFYNFFLLYASVLLLGHCVVVAAECNWYLLDISTNNIARGMVRGSQVRFESTKYVSVRTNLTTKRFLLSYTDTRSHF
jgi:hypothetical protein